MEAKNSKPNVRINMAMVEWNQPIIEACVAIRSQKVKMLEVVKQLEDVSSTRRRQMKWEKEKLIHQ
jgi:hypothetical protein